MRIIREGFLEQKSILKLANNINNVVHYIIVFIRLCHVFHPFALLLCGDLVSQERNYY